MTSPPQQIIVDCPACRHVYERPPISLEPGKEFDDEHLRAARTATCPACGHVAELATLVVSGHVWRLGGAGRARPSL